MPATTDRIRLGVSSCLLGQEVRYDGTHKLDRYIVQTLGAVFDFVPLCPEVAVGLGVPRPPIRLQGDPAAPRAVGVNDPQRDVTEALRAYGRQAARQLEGISGYLLKSNSPSCGMAGVKVYAAGRVRRGSGLFAAELRAAHPLLPLEEEGRLQDPVLRDNFLERVFAYHRWQRLGPQPDHNALLAFHTAHKLNLMAHSAQAVRELGRLLADGRQPPPAVAERYIGGFMAALARPATAKRHADVLQHLLGYLKGVVTAAEKAEVLDAIDRYRRGEGTRSVPLTLLRHHFRAHPHPFVARQLYLYPEPDERLLRGEI